MSKKKKKTSHIYKFEVPLAACCIQWKKQHNLFFKKFTEHWNFQTQM